jgi:hypothetical protein
MAPRFLKYLLQKLCRHQFSWPHSGVYGQDYQICLKYGSTYQYDWATMRRTRRLASVRDGLAELKGKPGLNH